MLNRACLPGDVVALSALVRPGYRLTLRDTSAIMARRRIKVTYEAAREVMLPIMAAGATSIDRSVGTET